MRMKVAIVTEATASEGSTKCFQLEMPVAGRIFSFRAKSRIRSMPTKKPGMAVSSIAPTVLMVSMMLYCFTADKMPIGRPMNTAIRMPKKATLNVVGNRSKISSKTGFWLRYEVPKSPCTASEM